MDAPIPRREVLFEGCREEEIPNLPKEMIEKLIPLGQPLGFPAGSAVLLGPFEIGGKRLVIELGRIEGGGEGVLPSLASLRRQYARLHGFSGVEWIVPAVSCAKPNLKLHRVLEGRGFIVKQVAGVGEAYYFVDTLPNGFRCQVALQAVARLHSALTDGLLNIAITPPTSRRPRSDHRKCNQESPSWKPRTRP